MRFDCYTIHYQNSKYMYVVGVAVSKEEGKDQESINQVAHLAGETIWESDKTQGNITHKRVKWSAISMR